MEARSGLEAALAEMNDGKITAELLKEKCDWMTFKMKPPHASLSALLNAHSDRLDDEQLRTLMVEAEAVLNSRPITYPDTTVPDSVKPLSPSQILTLKSGIFMKETLASGSVPSQPILE